MTSYQQKQYKLFNDLENESKLGKYTASVVRPVKDYINDNRICFTSVVFVSKKIQKEISKLIKQLELTDDRQYYYLPNSLHLTIQNIRAINYPPNFSNNDIENVKRIFEEVIPKSKKFSFELKGLFSLPTSLSIRGYCNDNLKPLVLELREKLKNIGIADDKTYASNSIFFGNVNFCRYTTKPNKKFFEKIDELKNVTVGEVEVKKISLITTNSACHPSKTKIIGEYRLKT